MQKKAQLDMMNRSQAETVAARALAWLAQDVERMSGFFAMTGLDHGDVATTLGKGEGLGSVIDYLMTQDRLVLEFCEEINLDPDQILYVRAALPGGDLPHWT